VPRTAVDTSPITKQLCFKPQNKFDILKSLDFQKAGGTVFFASTGQRGEPDGCGGCGLGAEERRDAIAAVTDVLKMSPE
jgi:hypothetical protein